MKLNTEELLALLVLCDSKREDYKESIQCELLSKLEDDEKWLEHYRKQLIFYNNLSKKLEKMLKEN